VNDTAKKKKVKLDIEDIEELDFEEDFLEDDYDFDEDIDLLDLEEPIPRYPDIEEIEKELEQEPEDVDFWISECLLVRHYDDRWNREREPYVICGDDKDAYLDKLNRANNVMKYRGSMYHWDEKPRRAKNYKDAMVMAGGLYNEFCSKKVPIDTQRVDEIVSRPYCMPSQHQMNFSGVVETPGWWSTASCDEESEWCYQYDASGIERYVPDYFER